MTECAVVFMNWLQRKDENREGLTLGEEFFLNLIQVINPHFKETQKSMVPRRSSLKRVFAKVQSLSVSNPLKYNCYVKRTMA